MEGRYIIAHDLGTSASKSVLIDKSGNILATSTNDYPLYTPNPGWVEQEPDDYWKAIVQGTKEILKSSNSTPEDIAGIVCTTQSMGIIPVGKNGEVLRRNITWVDGRAEKQAKKLMKLFMGEEVFKSIVGIGLMGKDIIPKLMWIKENEPEVYRKTDKFLDVNGYLKFCMTGKKVMDITGASAYGISLKKKDFLYSFFKIAKIDKEKLPPIVKSIDMVEGLTKEAAETMGLREGIPVFGGCDDVQSASIGSGAVLNGEAHIYLGTSAWVCAVTNKVLKHKHGANVLPSAHPDMNIIVGITEAAGSCIQWIMDEFFKHEKEDPNIKNIYELMDDTVRKVPPGSSYLIFTPWVMGERCPVSSTTTRSTFFNLCATHKREHLMRAVYEGVAYNLRWILENFKRDFKINFDKLRIIGGGSLDKEWMQIIADVTKKEIETIHNPKVAGAIGAAYCAAIGLGIYKDFSEIKDFVKVNQKYIPQKGNAMVYDDLFRSYKDIYYALEKPYKKINDSRF